LLITLEPGSRATLVLDHAPSQGSGCGLTNLVGEIDVGANASLDLVVIQREGDESFHVSNLAARVGRDGRFTAHTVSVGGALVRNDLEVLLAEEGAECELRGLFLGSGSRLVDNHTAVDHAVPHCTSRELYKGVLSGRSKGVFRGRVVVRPDAQKTDATQSNPNLLLGDRAEIDTKPQLEIYADDVKCSHGATVGQLDEDALFYLRSRGIGQDDARELLVRAFANEIIEALPVGGEITAALQQLVGALGEGGRGA
jgi:Fe-S cluster assembly protein SufD